eukprot:TCALIF_10431-PA protein Name:"Protein of unknown function" AED:0.01 eAED:0.01 QI:0/0.5/0.33/0.66/0.5/0.33/3/50/1148
MNRFSTRPTSRQSAAEPHFRAAIRKTEDGLRNPSSSNQLHIGLAYTTNFGNHVTRALNSLIDVTMMDMAGDPGAVDLLADVGGGLAEELDDDEDGLPPAVPPLPRRFAEPPPPRTPATLEECAMTAYLRLLENECAAFVLVSSLAAHSLYLRSAPQVMLDDLKTQLRRRMSGIASSSLRQAMLKRVLSAEFPTQQNWARKKSVSYKYLSVRTNLECPHDCCSGAYIRDTMAGVLMSSELRSLSFALPPAGQPRLEIPSILTHYAQSVVENRVALVERIFLPENYLEEEPSRPSPCGSATQSHARFLQAFSRQVPCYQHEAYLGDREPKHGRTGLLQSLWLLFRHIPDLDLKFNKLTEIVLRNNVQCQIYSQANFQFDFLQRIGLGCPRLRVLDLFGTDTWADCLVAFFFRDAFHSLHRFLYFFSSGEDEEEIYHPHNIRRYCQFCLDQNHPKGIERPFTTNPIIPLLDVIYNHVLKKYPRRSYCILRNCIPVSQLVHAPQSTVFEILRDESFHQVGGGPQPSSPLGRGTLSADHGSSSKEPASSPSFVRARLRDRASLAKKSQASLGQGTSESACDIQPSTSVEPVVCSKVPSNEDHHAPPLSLSGEELTVVRRRSQRLRQKHREPDSCYYVDQQRGRTTAHKGSRSVKRPCSPGPSGSGPSSRKKRVVSAEEAHHRVRAPPASGPNTAGQSPSMAMGGGGTAKPPSLERLEYGRWFDETYRCSCKKRKSNKTCAVKTNPDTVSRVGVWRKCSSQPGWKVDQEWVEPESVQCREILQWPHLNPCVETLEVLNIGGTNVLGEFIPFLLKHAPNIRSLGQWLNTLVYGIEIMQDMNPNLKLPKLEEFSYSSDRNFFCQPYIGFVPETNDFRNVRKEMLRFSGRVANRVNPSSRNHAQKIRQLQTDMNLVQRVCPNIRKLNLVVHFKVAVLSDQHLSTWNGLRLMDSLTELDLVTVLFVNVKALIQAVGGQLRALVIEMDEEQGTGLEIVHIARHCPELRSLRMIMGDKILRGEMTLHFGSVFFRHLESVEVDGSVHLHAFAFFWGHCRSLRHLKLGLVVSNEIVGNNVLIFDVFTLLFRVNPMHWLEQFHIKNLRIRSLPMAYFLLEHMPRLKAASSWIIDLPSLEEFTELVGRFKRYEEAGVKLDYKRW